MITQNYARGWFIKAKKFKDFFPRDVKSNESATASQANGHDLILKQFMHSFTKQSLARFIQ